jgi:two-component system cell cycle response regulator DivK
VALDGTHLTVLLVEDDLDGRRMYANWLTDAGFLVLQAHNGLQALERAFDSTPDVVVTDLNIPGIDGFELTRRLRRDPRTCDVPVLAVTGYTAFASDPWRALRAGCDAVLYKPCLPEEVETAIHGLMQERAQRFLKKKAMTQTALKPLILVVEDFDDAREMYRDYLEFSGFRVETARDGREAIDKAQALQPDLILMDLSLPGVDGWEATRLLKADPATSHLVIVALSAHAMAAEGDRARDAGCDGFIAKPCLPPDLVTEVSRYLKLQSDSHGHPGSRRK